MNAAALCLAIDSVALSLRKVNCAVMYFLYCLDHKLPVSDTKHLRDDLERIQLNIEYLMYSVHGNLFKRDETVEKMIDPVVVDELEAMLKIFVVKKSVKQASYYIIQTCQYVIENSNNFEITNYLWHLMMNNHNHYSAFTFLANTNALCANDMIAFLDYRLSFLSNLFEMTHKHLHQLDTVDALLGLKYQQLITDYRQFRGLSDKKVVV
ncbi:ORF119 [Spodoptera eridania nucleopolyhedrovirus]|uniref:ORF119 n=1 Tax=Spodoptera eridania nucleopolyhedrovirus TaxID=2315721 RepID=A0A346TQ54_9ABAC|nr:ORF119 [Spodoptera eridania nucleopolyhedrovirus]AXU41714.1 ORF119 [Spodoptera eridania nucleopolyhedrovirus]